MTDNSIPFPLIEPETLFRHLRNHTRPGIKLIDASYTMPGAHYDAHDQFNRARIGNAVFFDIDGVADKTSHLPHMVPSAPDFANAVSAMGISNSDQVVIYDQFGIAMAASRAWWMFRLFGHENVCVLNGGLPYWIAQGLPVSTDTYVPAEPALYNAERNPALIAQATDILKTLDRHEATIIDARSAERFSGNTSEPRAGLSCGHIPGSLNIPFTRLLDPATGHLVDSEILEDCLADIDTAKPVIASCGSGVTACVIALAFAATGKPDVAVYDGSWAEWGQTSRGLPIE